MYDSAGEFTIYESALIVRDTPKRLRYNESWRNKVSEIGESFDVVGNAVGYRFGFNTTRAIAVVRL